jgi:TonB family protein
MSYSPVHPGAENLKKPLAWSVGLHAILFLSLGVSTLFSHRGDLWGGPGGDSAVSVGLVGKLPGVPLPHPEAVTTSRVVDTSKGLYKSEPLPKPIPKEKVIERERPKEKLKEIAPAVTTRIPEFTKEKEPRYITTPSKILEDPTPPPPNAIPYGQGGTPALPYTQFTSGGATQGGMLFTSPGAGGGAGGGDFAGRFPAYVEAVRNRISSNWLQSSVDPSVRWAPRTMFTFQILRDGTVTNAQLTQSSGNRSVDNSALRAVLSSSPVSPLPSNYSGSTVSVEFWFEFRR